MLERDKLEPKQADTVEIILDNTRHLVRLLNDLLDLARSDAGRLTIKPAVIDVGALVEDPVRTMLSQTQAKDQMLTQAIAPGLPPVNVDRDRIRQVLVNLLTNAHEYCAAGASIHVTANSNGGGVELAVSDNGPGMAADQLDHIFERFTRGDAGLTQHVGGTGLGLAISKSLVELHGGAISAQSVEGQGSTFRVWLPALAGSGVEEPRNDDVGRAPAQSREEAL
jgi:signal transduction histidine kinase